MKYCIKYNSKLKYLKEIDEILIHYNLKDTHLIDFLLAHSEKRIILDILNEELEDFIKDNHLVILKEIKKKYPDLNFCLRFNTLDKKNIELIKEYGIPYFFKVPAGEWDTFNLLIQRGATDIYVVEGLGFDLQRVAKKARENNLKIRVFPNIAQAYRADVNCLMKFFIRPEDIDKYEKYIDVCEFISKDIQDDTLYKIYKYDKKWFGSLDEIIIDLNSNLDNRFLIPSFADRRINCDRECLKGGICQKCQVIANLSKTLEQAGLAINPQTKNKKL